MNGAVNCRASKQAPSSAALTAVWCPICVNHLSASLCPQCSNVVTSAVWCEVTLDRLHNTVSPDSRAFPTVKAAELVDVLEVGDRETGRGRIRKRAAMYSCITRSTYRHPAWPGDWYAWLVTGLNLVDPQGRSLNAPRSLWWTTLSWRPS